MNHVTRALDPKGRNSFEVKSTGENINIAFSPDGQYVAVGNKDDHISVIDTRKRKAVKRTKFGYEVNEFQWSKNGDHFLLSTGQGNGSGTVELMRFAADHALKPLRTIFAHTAQCYCLETDPSDKYLAVGSADALVSLWDLEELICIRTFDRLEWPVRTLSFSYDSAYLASASEDNFIDIANVQTGEQVYSQPVKDAMNSVAWHPSAHILAYAGDPPTNKRDRQEREGEILLLVPKKGGR
jgi:THO complex subunit 3